MLLPRFTETRIELERKVAAIILEVGEGPSTTTVQRATLPGDTRRLRGLPAVARGVSGVAPGTDPVQALLLSDRLRYHPDRQ